MDKTGSRWIYGRKDGERKVVQERRGKKNVMLL